jgi:hypothetical protein
MTGIWRADFIHLAVCLTTGPKRALHIVQSRASSFRWEYPLLSLSSSSSFLRLLHRLPFTSIPPFIFPSITSCRRQFLRKMWPTHLAFRLLIWCRTFLCCLTLSNTCEELCTFMTISRWSILRMRNVSNKSCIENRNAHFTCRKCFFSKITQFMR